MNLYDISSMDISQYHNQIIESSIAKLENGAKTIIIAMPTGSGKTAVAQKIAMRLCEKEPHRILFIVGLHEIKEQFIKRTEFGKLHCDILSCDELFRKMASFQLNYDYIFIDGISISERRKLARILEDYHGAVISMTIAPWDT